ncbi:MAG: His/Gly/Thr/Pro-type tRNA ligase C-terminal domain-containing protein, partial [Candidatus Limnocylindria bacterium]
LGGGGRYDGLIELLGGRPTPGIGFGIGLDRTVIALAEAGIEAGDGPALVAVVGADDDKARRLQAASELRDAGLAVRPDGSSRKLGKQLESAAKAGAKWAVIIGEGGSLVLRDLERGEQQAIASTAEVAAAVSG